MSVVSNAYVERATAVDVHNALLQAILGLSVRGSDGRTLALLLAHADALGIDPFTDGVRISLGALANAASVSRGTAVRWLRDLEQSGFVKTIRSARGCNCYVVDECIRQHARTYGTAGRPRA